MAGAVAVAVAVTVVVVVGFISFSATICTHKRLPVWVKF